MNACLKTTDNLTIGCWETFFAPAATDFDSLASQLKTGDLYLATADPAGGRIPGQYTISATPWDHVGMIWRHEDKIYVIDSGAFRYYSHLSRRPLHFGDGAAPPDCAWKIDGSGPQMYPLKEFIEEMAKRPLEVKPGKPSWYYSRIGIRPLAKPLSDGELAKLTASLESMRDAPYQKDEDSPGEMTKAAVDLCDCIGLTYNARESRESLFCSEIVAALYMDAGLIRKDIPSANYVPGEFSKFHGNNLSSLCCCCWASYLLGACGVGDMQRAAGSDAGAGRLFAEEFVLKTSGPPAVGAVAKVAPQ